MALNAMDYARLTGQTVYTIEVFQPLRNLWNRVRDWVPASVSAGGLAWMSKYIYRYHRLMLANLSPRSPATLNWPLYLYPPPHLLVGYQYLVRTCNDYIFDTRSYSRLRYHDTVRASQHYVFWSTTATCSYTINTGTYHRFIDLDNFEETLAQVQQAILAERVVADLALLRPLRGYGRTSMDADQNVPVEQMLQEQNRDMGRCQERAWGMADRIRIQRAGRKDLVVLTAIRRLKTAYFNYLLSRDQQTKLSLPCNALWLEAFVERFSDPVDSDSLRRCLRGEGTNHNRQLLQCVVSALSLPSQATESFLRGGAFELRPRENGRAVTEEMRRRRGEIIERFVDRLPIRRRRRRVAAPAPVSDVEEEEEEPFAAAPEGFEEEEEAAGPPAPPPSFEEEVRAAVAGAIRLLEEELTVAARDHHFFNFAIDFYQAMLRLETLGDINELTLRRWVMYFFVAEHIATTLNYLHHNLRLYAPFARHLDIPFAQVIMRARDAEGRNIYNRVWNENGTQAFPALMRRISRDLAATVERAGQGELDEDEAERFMQDIAFHDNSGDVEEILRQVAMNDAQIDSVEISFRFRVIGPVVFSQKREIQNINRRVVQLATQLQRQRQPLPELNQVVALPPVGAAPH
ncbi:pre-terminal protein [Bat mastadenovirus WIV10]|uniref:Preterminal protein n=1 Tax=Bat mastadenovirus WIV10 TaxID=1788432 RepID=A0A161DY92_9ADEN|nr:pre-terminal protein [Bat mastadenovirus WIV10]AMB43083.1 pre-terminal protein [Bat mastadenovirus WIV10]